MAFKVSSARKDAFAGSIVAWTAWVAFTDRSAIPSLDLGLGWPGYHLPTGHTGLLFAGAAGPRLYSFCICVWGGHMGCREAGCEDGYLYGYRRYHLAFLCAVCHL